MKNQHIISRKELFKLAGIGAAALVLKPDLAQASSECDVENSAAMLFDATLCVGCRTCEVACREVHHLDANVPRSDDLSADDLTLIKQYREGSDPVFRKYQCMHCVEPACVSACPVQALHKLENGPVVYDQEKCIGCRYCMAACPFNVPRIDWNELLPVITKCDLCSERIKDDKLPACAEACPMGALTFGTRKEILEEACARIQATPGKYVEHIYGQTEGGGTSWLYLSPVPFEKLGFPDLESKPVPELSEKVAVYGTPSMLLGVAYILGTIVNTTRNNKDGDSDAGPER